jgi:molecular chaperone DnaJ
VTPSKLSDEQKELLRQFSGVADGAEPVEHHESIFDKMKKALFD